MNNITLKELLDHLKDIKILVNCMIKNDTLGNNILKNDILKNDIISHTVNEVFEKNNVSSENNASSENKIIYLSSDDNTKEKIKSLSSPSSQPKLSSHQQQYKHIQSGINVPQKENVFGKKETHTYEDFKKVYNNPNQRNVEYVILNKKPRTIK